MSKLTSFTFPVSQLTVDFADRSWRAGPRQNARPSARLRRRRGSSGKLPRQPRLRQLPQLPLRRSLGRSLTRELPRKLPRQQKKLQLPPSECLEPGVECGMSVRRWRLQSQARLLQTGLACFGDPGPHAQRCPLLFSPGCSNVHHEAVCHPSHCAIQPQCVHACRAVEQLEAQAQGDEEPSWPCSHHVVSCHAMSRKRQLQRLRALNRPWRSPMSGVLAGLWSSWRLKSRRTRSPPGSCHVITCRDPTIWQLGLC